MASWDASAEQRQRWRKAIDRLLRGIEADGPCVVVSAAICGQPVYQRALGLASIQHRKKASLNTRLRIGSSSKQFTALALLLLAEDGRLRLGDDLGRYLPELPSWAARATLEQALAHTSGVRCHVNNGFVVDHGRLKPAGWSMRSLSRQLALNSVPGSRWLYSNGGYHLLSEVIARASGTDFESFLAERIFRPLEMTATESVPSDLSIVKGLADLHVPDGTGGYRRGVFPHEDIRGEGGIVSTVGDLMKWLAHLRQPDTVGSPDTWASMLTPAQLSDGTQLPYCKGLLRLQLEGREVIQHAGGVVGGAAQTLTVPGEGIDVVVLTNGAAVSPGSLAREIASVLLPRATSAAPRPAQPAATSTNRPLVGRHYHSATGTLIKFVDSDGTLAVSLFSNPAAPLEVQGGDLRVEYETALIGPLVVKDLATGCEEAPSELVFREGDTTQILRLLPTDAPKASPDSSPVGLYESDELGARAEIVFERHTLVMNISGEYGRLSAVLSPLSEHVYQWEVHDALFPLVGSLTMDPAPSAANAGFTLDIWNNRGLRYRRVPKSQAA